MQKIPPICCAVHNCLKKAFVYNSFSYPPRRLFVSLIVLLFLMTNKAIRIRFLNIFFEDFWDPRKTVCCLLCNYRRTCFVGVGQGSDKEWKHIASPQFVCFLFYEREPKVPIQLKRSFNRKTVRLVIFVTK